MTAKTASTRIKTEAATFVPKGREDVVEAIAEIGRRQRERTRIETAMNDKLAKIKETFEEEGKPHGDEIRRISEGIRVWCEANRDELTREGKIKTVSLSSGDVGWRIRPPKVVVKAAEKAIEALKKVGLGRFVRQKEEVNKEEILSAKALAAVKGKDEKNEDILRAAKDMDLLECVKGIKVEQGEDFFIKPFETELEEIA